MNIKCAHREIVSLHKLVPNPKNTNKHPASQINLLAKIIDYQGIRHPIVVSNLSGFIVAGHGRLEAAKKLGYDSFPVDYQDFENAAQEYAFLESDNHIAELAEHDLEMMKSNLLELPDLDLEMLALPDLEVKEVDIDAIPDEKTSKEEFQKMTFTFSSEQMDIARDAIEKARGIEDCSDEINKQDESANALIAILKQYIYQQ